MQRMKEAALRIASARGVPGTAGALVADGSGRLLLLANYHVVFGGGAAAGDPVWAIPPGCEGDCRRDAVWIGVAERGWLAAKLERIDRRFLDRLNTLLFLEKQRADPKAGSFAIKIAQQTKQTFGSELPRSPFSLKRAGLAFAVFAGLVVLTLGVYHRYSPWPRLAASARARPAAAQDARNLELAAPATNNVEENKNWGEVRITDPGCDLKVTKVDVVPLQIEAAANEALSRVGDPSR